MWGSCTVQLQTLFWVSFFPYVARTLDFHVKTGKEYEYMQHTLGFLTEYEGFNNPSCVYAAQGIPVTAVTVGI